MNKSYRLPVVLAAAMIENGFTLVKENDNGKLLYRDIKGQYDEKRRLSSWAKVEDVLMDKVMERKAWRGTGDTMGGTAWGVFNSYGTMTNMIVTDRKRCNAWLFGTKPEQFLTSIYDEPVYDIEETAEGLMGYKPAYIKRMS